MKYQKESSATTTKSPNLKLPELNVGGLHVKMTDLPPRLVPPTRSKLSAESTRKILTPDPIFTCSVTWEIPEPNNRCKNTNVEIVTASNYYQTSQ
jgi:hypothetical protein